VDTQAEDKLGVEGAWFVIVTAETDETSPDAVALSMLVTALEDGLLTFALTPLGVSVVVGARSQDEATVLGARLVAVGKALGARRVAGRLTDKIEEAIPAARPAAKEDGGG